MREITVRSFQANDASPVVALWNDCLVKDPITPSRFWRLFLLDENFDTDGALVAELGGKVIGFLQAMARRVAYGSMGTESERGWITVFFVHPEYRRQGVGTALLEHGLAFLRERGRSRVSCNGYAPIYLFPGVDEDYQAARAFLEARGFALGAEAVAMGMPLEGVQAPQAVQDTRARFACDNVLVRLFEERDTLPLLAFVETHFAHWAPSVRDSLNRGSGDILVAVRNQTEIWACAQWQNPHTDPPNGAPGRFGPFGVRPDLRNQGLGAVVFYAMIEHALGNGTRYLWFGWAGGRNLSFYERAGCRITRRFHLYQSTL